MQKNNLADQVASITERISNVCARVGRDPSEITLLAVSKTKPAQMVLDAVKVGVTHFGENKFQECPEKLEAVNSALGRDAEKLQWHFIGHLQSNKVKKVLELFTIIESLDSEKVIERVDRIAGELGIVARGLLQVNVSGTVSQYGFGPHQLPAALEAVEKCENLRVEGLMAIGPHDSDEYLVHRAFERIRLEAERIEKQGLRNIIMNTLSMGMTNDFEIAIEEGSTEVRLGTSIFGAREYTKS
ncbi:YggS family pyridoxal phosphate-dependent enzyme [bacterium]|nr:YggS family pyridoxal phosphate-dependent enzyme [bacterium]